jgi:hypothetical protein
MTRAAVAAVALCLLAGACSKPPSQLQGDAATVDLALQVRGLIDRELMLVDERLEMQALDGTVAASDVAPQLSSASQQLLGAPISDAARDTIVSDQKAAAQTFFGYVDAAIARSADPQWRAVAAGRMGEIRADYSDAMTKGLDPGPELSSAYVMLARSRGVQAGAAATPFDNAQADADRVLPSSPSLPPAAAQPVMPVGGG